MAVEVDSPAIDEAQEKAAALKRFNKWLQDQLADRGWSRSEAARRGRISASMYDKVLNGIAEPGLDFLRGVSKAFGVPLEDVFRIAGVLPPTTATNPTIGRLVAQIGELPGASRDAAIGLVQAMITFVKVTTAQAERYRRWNWLLDQLQEERVSELLKLLAEEIQQEKAGESASVDDEGRAPDQQGKVG